MAFVESGRLSDLQGVDEIDFRFLKIHYQPDFRRLLSEIKYNRYNEMVNTIFPT